MLLTIRYVQMLPLLCAVCHLTLAFPTQTPSAYDNVQSLQVDIPHSGAVSAPLGSSIAIPCLVALSSTPTTTSSSPIVPRVKWTVVSGGVETQILVARGQRVKVNEAYRDRAVLLNYTSSPDDLSLWLEDLRSSDSGHYRCEVQQGLEDASDLVQLKVKGVVFHYRDALGRYAFSYHQAQRACEAIGAEIATPDQLLAAYYDGYEQCDAGWLADQSVRYPIQVPREGCYGDMDGQPGVRNYGTMDADDLFDVYCYVEQIDGEVFHDSVPQQLSFDKAQSYCRDAGAELATTAQLYLAWSEGLDRCSPGWLSDGSVRYPIVTPRERCGGPQAGVKTLYRFSNQTGFPEPSSLHDIYCFKDSRNTPTHSSIDYVATEPEDIGQDVVILTETDQELQLNQHAEQVEREAQSALESFPFISSPSTEQNLFDTHTAVTSDTTDSPPNATATMDLLQPFDETSSSAEMSSDSQHPTALMNSTISSTETLNLPQNTSLPYNETDSHHNMNFTFHSSDLESTESPKLSYAPYTQNQTVPFTAPTTSKQPSVSLKESQAIQQANLDLNRSQANYSETDSNSTVQENIQHRTTMPPDLAVKLEEAAVEDPVQMSLSTQLPIDETELRTQTTLSTIKETTTLWPLLDGSGDISQEIDLHIESAINISTSVSYTSSVTTHSSLSASASSTTAKHQTAVPDPTLSSGSQNIDKLGFNILSTTAQLWESSNSRQEGSTSSEADDTVTMEIEDKRLYPTTSEKLVSGVSFITSESPERSNTSQLPTGSTKTEYRTSGYREYLDTATAVYEEASGQEPGIVTATLVEADRVGTAYEEDLKVSQIIEGEVTVPTLEEELKVSQTLEEDPKDYFSLEKETTVAPAVAIEEEPLTFEEGANLMPPIEEETKLSPVFEEETNIAPTLALDEETNIAPTLALDEETNIAPTLALEEETNIAPTLALEEETNIAPTLALEEEAKVSTMLEEEVSITPSFEKEVDIVLTPEEETTITPTLEDEANIAPTVEEEANIALTHEEEANNVPSIEEEAKVAPTTQEDFTIFPLHSSTSNWPLLSTTTGPQESLNDFEYSKKTPSITARTSPDSSLSTRSSAATTKSTPISTHLSRHIWSPTTTTRVFHKTTEPQKVTHLIPPVDHGLVDVEFSLTQPPTLLILPNERAAVGGAGKVSDACVDNPCLNGGTCTDQDGQIECLCLPTYEGNFCQTDLERCEPGWDKFHGFCYRHFSQRLSWEVAEKHCRVLGAHLVSIMSPEEQSYINSNFKEYQWTGLNDKTIEDDFRWSDGNPLLYENWYRGQPDSYFLSGEDCVVMVWHDDGRWSDVPCNYHLAYTCKKGTSSCGPPPKPRNASIYGKVRQRYETSAIVRYYCAKGFQQKLNPLIRCLPGGRWERPQILCIPESGIVNDYLEANSKFAMTEDEFQATKETPQYWDIKF